MSTFSNLNRVNPKKISRVFDYEAILQSIGNILRQPKRQRLFRPEGVDLEQLLFTNDVDTEFRVKNTIFEAVQEDPRVKLVYSQTYVEADPDNHVFNVVAKFQIIGLPGQTFTRTFTVAGT